MMKVGLPEGYIDSPSEKKDDSSSDSMGIEFVPGPKIDEDSEEVPKALTAEDIAVRDQQNDAMVGDVGIDASAEAIPEVPVFRDEDIKAENAPEKVGNDALDVGRERLTRFGNFLGRVKNGFVEKVKWAGRRISNAVGQTVKYAGMTGLAVLSADELAKRGADVALDYTAEKYDLARNKAIEVKNSAVASYNRGVDFVQTTAQDTVDLGRLSIARATERFTNPFARFQAKMFGARLRRLAERFEKGKPIDPDQLVRLQEKVRLLQDVSVLKV